MDRTAFKKISIRESDEAYCLDLSPEQRLAVLAELNRIGMVALGFSDAPMLRSVIRKISFREFASESVVVSTQ